VKPSAKAGCLEWSSLMKVQGRITGMNAFRVAISTKSIAHLFAEQGQV